MFGLYKYMDKMYNIKWYMNEKEKKSLEDIMCVEFIKYNEYYILNKIHYTLTDILLALEGIDFELIKSNNEMTITILKV